MTGSAPQHDAVWIRQLAAELQRAGCAADQILGQAGVDRQKIAADGARLPFSKHAAVFELAAEAMQDPCLGLNFGRSRDTRDAGLIGYVGLASPSLVDALKNLARYRRVFSDAAEMDVSDLLTDGSMRWWFHGSGVSGARQCVEFSAANLLRAVRGLVGEPITPLQVSFVHPRRDGRADFEAFFGCKVVFGAAENVIVLRKADLARPIRSADDRLLALLLRYCEEVLSRHSAPPPALVERVERMIADRLSKGEARLATVAAACGMSTRSLTRRLAEHGTSFKDLVENLRRELALRYLEETTLSLTEIAFLLGYSEVSSFNHAFRRWTGKTPSTVRSRVRA